MKLVCRIALLLLAVLWFVLPGVAQDESLFSRIEGVNMKDKLYLKWDSIGKKYLYLVQDGSGWHDLDDDLIFKVRNQHKNNFKVLVQFYNPLRLSMKSEAKEIEDPELKRISEFLTTVSSSIMPGTPAPSGEAPAYTFNKNAAAAVASDKINLMQSVFLHDWLYNLSLQLDTAVIAASADNSTAFDNLTKLLKQVANVDKVLYEKFDVQSIPEYSVATMTFPEWIKTRNTVMYKLDNDYDVFKAEWVKTDTVYEQLKRSVAAAEQSLIAITDLMTKYYDQIDRFIKASGKDAFKKYTYGEAVVLSEDMSSKLAERKVLLEKFSTYLKKLNEHLVRFKDEKMCDNSAADCHQYAIDYNVKLVNSAKIMKVFTYEAKHLDKDGGEVAGLNGKGTFTVGKKLFFYPFISSGVLYTQFKYPNYAATTANGVSTVGKAPDTKVNLRPAVFLNCLLAGWDGVYPFLQLGVTTGVNDALFPVGGGFALGKSFSLSGGVLLGYHKDLDKLSVGDTVSGELDIKNDLTNKAAASWYFSINYNFGKK